MRRFILQVVEEETDWMCERLKVCTVETEEGEMA